LESGVRYMTQELTGEAWIRAIKQDYVNSYSYAICDALRRADPDTFNKVFGSLENCVKEVMDDASVWFEKWKPNWVRGIIARVKSTPTS